MKPLILAATIVSLLLAGGFAYAQPPQGPPPQGGEAGPPPGPPPGEFQGPPEGPGMFRGGPPQGKEDKELREMVETIMMAKLSQRLGLTDEQALQLVRNRTKFKEQAEQMRKQRRDLLKSLRETLQSATADEAALKQKLQELREQDVKLLSMRQQTFEEASKGLSAVQSTKLYLFMEEFEGDMQRLVQRARERGAEDMRRNFQNRREREGGDFGPRPFGEGGPQGQRPGGGRPGGFGGLGGPRPPQPPGPGGPGVQPGPPPQN